MRAVVLRRCVAGDLSGTERTAFGKTKKASMEKRSRNTREEADEMGEQMLHVQDTAQTQVLYSDALFN